MQIPVSWDGVFKVLRALARRPLLDRIALQVPLKKPLIHPNYLRVYS